MDETLEQFENKTGKKLLGNEYDVTEEEVKKNIIEKLSEYDMDIPIEVKFDKYRIRSYTDAYTKEKIWDIIFDKFDNKVMPIWISERFNGTKVEFNIDNHNDIIKVILLNTKKELTDKARNFLFRESFLGGANTFTEKPCTICKKDTSHIEAEGEDYEDPGYSICLDCIVNAYELHKGDKHGIQNKNINR